MAAEVATTAAAGGGHGSGGDAGGGSAGGGCDDRVGVSGGGEVEVEVEGEVEGEGVDPLALNEVGGVGEGGVGVEVVERLNIEEVETYCADEDVVDVRVRGGASSPTAEGCSLRWQWFIAMATPYDATGGRGLGEGATSDEQSGRSPSSRGTACIAGRPRFFSGSAEEAGRPGRGGACWKNEEIRVLLRRGSALTGSLPALTVNVGQL